MAIAAVLKEVPDVFGSYPLEYYSARFEDNKPDDLAIHEYSIPHGPAAMPENIMNRGF
jgi:hypothetical protein